MEIRIIGVQMKRWMKEKVTGDRPKKSCDMTDTTRVSGPERNTKKDRKAARIICENNLCRTNALHCKKD